MSDVIAINSEPAMYELLDWLENISLNTLFALLDLETSDSHIALLNTW